MEPLSFIILLGVVGGLAVTFWGLFSRRKSPWIALIAGLWVPLATIGSWYSLVESESWAWALVYGLVGLAALISCVRQFVGSPGRLEHRPGARIRPVS